MAIGSFVDGMFFALGTMVVTTIGGILLLKITRSWLVKNIAELWDNIKKEGLRLDGITVEGKFKTKKLSKKKK